MYTIFNLKLKFHTLDVIMFYDYKNYYSSLILRLLLLSLQEKLALSC
jgi:hypothetical protein